MSEAAKLPREQELLDAAVQARDRAYAPYSQFPVGAALLGSDGEIYIGCNVENGSYGLSVCAERHAIAAAVIAGCKHFEAVVIIAETESPISPCGACRQVLSEFGDMTVVMYGRSGDRDVCQLTELLPRAFQPDVIDEVQARQKEDQG